MKMPSVGDRFFDKSIGNRAGRAAKVIEVEVTRSGRKYFACCPVEYVSAGKVSRHLETEYFLRAGRIVQKTDYCQDHALYRSLQEISDQEELASLNSYFRFSVFDCSVPRLPLDALRRMKAIADEVLPPAGSP